MSWPEFWQMYLQGLVFIGTLAVPIATLLWLVTRGK